MFVWFVSKFCAATLLIAILILPAAPAGAINLLPVVRQPLPPASPSSASHSLTYTCSGSGDYSGLQNAINSADSGGVGGMVTVSQGICDLGTSTITIPSSVTVQGLNMGMNTGGNFNGTTLRYSGNGSAIRGANLSGPNRSITLQNLTIQIMSTGALFAIDASGWQFGTIRNVGIIFPSASTGTGIKFASANSTTINSNAYFNTVDGSVIYNVGGVGVEFIGSGITDHYFPSGQNQNRIEGGSIEALIGVLMDDDGVSGDYHDGNYIAGVDFENGGCANCIGIEINQGIQNTMVGNRYEFASSATAIKYGPHAKGNLALGGYTYSKYADASGAFSFDNPNAFVGPFGPQSQQQIQAWSVNSAGDASSVSNSCAGTAQLSTGAASIRNSCLQPGHSVTCTESSAIPAAIGCSVSAGSLSITSALPTDSSLVSWSQNN